jgi:hypothetical protein
MLKQKEKAIVIPPALDNSPGWVAHTAQLHQLQNAAGRSDARLRELEAARAEATRALADAQVGELLGDTASGASVADLKERLAESDRRLTAGREQLDVEQAAVRRVEHRGVEIRSRVHAEIREAVERTHRELLARFGEHIEAMQPTIRALRDLRGAHPGAFESSRVPMWNELHLALPDSKAAVWLREARALGVDVAG